MASTIKSITPIGDRWMVLAEMSGVASAAIDIGISNIDSLNIQARSGSSDNAGTSSMSGTVLTLASYQAAGTYMIRVIGV